MDIDMTLSGPLTRASHALGVCPGQTPVLRPSCGSSGMAKAAERGADPIGVDAFGTYVDTDLVDAVPFVGTWFGSEPPVAERPRPDAVSILDPHAASAPRRWSP